MSYFRNIKFHPLKKDFIFINKKLSSLLNEFFYCSMKYIPTNKFIQSRSLTTTINNLQEKEKSTPQYEVTFVKKNGERIKVTCNEGDSLLDVVLNNNLDFDGYGACGGTLTCSTCHVILKKEDFDRLPDTPTEEENDMLDLAYEYTDTSRLGCQIRITKDLNGLEVCLPSSINDARS